MEPRGTDFLFWSEFKTDSSDWWRKSDAIYVINLVEKTRLLDWKIICLFWVAIWVDNLILLALPRGVCVLKCTPITPHFIWKHRSSAHSWLTGVLFSVRGFRWYPSRPFRTKPLACNTALQRQHRHVADTLSRFSSCSQHLLGFPSNSKSWFEHRPQRQNHRKHCHLVFSPFLPFCFRVCSIRKPSSPQSG